MRREIFQNIEIPKGVNAEVNGKTVIIEGKEGKNERKFDTVGLKLEKKGNELIIGEEKATKNEKRRINSIASHIKNMIQGVQGKFEYKLKVCFSHFPVNVEVKGKEAIIKNFLGEKTPRKVQIPEGAEVKVEKDVITVRASDIETAGQAAANFENATRIPNKDRRVFLDGIFITSKCGVEI